MTTLGTTALGTETERAFLTDVIHTVSSLLVFRYQNSSLVIATETAAIVSTVNGVTSIKF